MSSRTYIFSIFVFFIMLLILNLPIKPNNGDTNKSLINETNVLPKIANGYNIKEHTVFTKDSYVLTIFQMIKTKKCNAQTRVPVLLMHGLFMSSDTWLVAGPEAGLAYLLSDVCFDVWLGNARGTHYGRRHLKFNPDEDPEFWNFSADEIGIYDVPSIVDYVLEYTGAEKVNYVGYSQDGGTFFITCSERPGYCDKVGIFIALAPATRLTHIKSRPFRLLLDQFRILEDNLSSLGIKEVFSKGGVAWIAVSSICRFEWFLETICKLLEIMLDSINEGSIKSKTRREMLENFPVGTSVRNLARYGQALWNNAFQKFDYGISKNIELYGRRSPPNYNLSATSTPVVVFYARNDNLVDIKDINWLSNSLPNVIQCVEVEDLRWNHFDFMFSQYTKVLLFPKLFKYLTNTIPSKCTGKFNDTFISKV